MGVAYVRARLLVGHRWEGRHFDVESGGVRVWVRVRGGGRRRGGRPLPGGVVGIREGECADAAVQGPGLTAWSHSRRGGGVRSSGRSREPEEQKDVETKKEKESHAG